MRKALVGQHLQDKLRRQRVLLSEKGLDGAQRLSIAGVSHAVGNENSVQALLQASRRSLVDFRRRDGSLAAAGGSASCVDVDQRPGLDLNGGPQRLGSAGARDRTQGRS